MVKIVDGLVGLAKLLTGASAQWKDPQMAHSDKQTIYFANHTSNMDTLLIWTSLPRFLREKTRPVAAKDYWFDGSIKQHIAEKELNVVPVERNKETRTEDPLNPLRRALNEGYSLIIFPEGKRNQDLVPGEFKSGLFWLQHEYPDVQLVPVYLENVAKSFPKGAFFPLPIICKAHFGRYFSHASQDAQNKDEFLLMARQAVIEIIPNHINITNK